MEAFLADNYGFPSMFNNNVKCVFDCYSQASYYNKWTLNRVFLQFQLYSDGRNLKCQPYW